MTSAVIFRDQIAPTAHTWHQEKVYHSRFDLSTSRAEWRLGADQIYWEKGKKYNITHILFFGGKSCLLPILWLCFKAGLLSTPHFSEAIVRWFFDSSFVTGSIFVELWGLSWRQVLLHSLRCVRKSSISLWPSNNFLRSSEFTYRADISKFGCSWVLGYSGRYRSPAVTYHRWEL